jgi:hypothetical protein
LNAGAPVLVGVLHAGTLNAAQRETAHALRASLLVTSASLSAGLFDLDLNT